MFYLVVAMSLLLAGVVVHHAYREARRDPVVRRATIGLPDWPPGATPVRVALVSDIHLASAAMDQARLTRIVGQINALHPDLVLLAGDFIEGRDPQGAARMAPGLVAPLSRLRAPLGVVAVPGNHDYWTGIAAVRAALARANIRVLANQAIARGPLALAGIDDGSTGHANVRATLRALKSVRGARVAFTHSPEIAPRLPPRLPVLLAAHTHCGQIALPFIGPLAGRPRHGRRYFCGRIDDGKRTVFVTAGVGTSYLPLRLGAPPDMWLITFGPIAAGR